MLDLNKVIEDAKRWAYEAGKVQRDNYESNNLKITTKSTDVDLVTEIDELSENLIISAIKESYPHHAILSEESKNIKRDSEYLWIIDPLDGTTNYAQGLPIFAVSIALEYKGEIILGVIYQPILDEMFTSIRGKGAFLNGEKIKISSKNNLKDSVLATGFPYDRATNQDNNSNYFENMVPKVRGLRRMGAAAYDLANIACGRLDGYWELNLSPWDVAAGTLIIEESGGEVVKLTDKRDISIIAGNKDICELIMSEIKKVDGDK